MMKLRNPKRDAVADKTPGLSADNKTALRNAIAASDADWLTFDDLRQALPAPARKKVPDGVLHQFLMDEGHGDRVQR